MTPEQFKREIIARGIISVEKHEPRESRRRGCLHGFDLCYNLMTPEDFERILTQRHRKEAEMVCSQSKKEDFGEYRCATAQIEHVWERMKIAWNLPGPYYASAIKQYAEIVGVKEDSTHDTTDHTL